MTPNLVRLGDRYGDDSGWARRLEIDSGEPESSCAVEIELGGSHMSCSMDELWWLAQAIATARDHLGMDRQQLYPQSETEQST